MLSWLNFVEEIWLSSYLSLLLENEDDEIFYGGLPLPKYLLDKAFSHKWSWHMWKSCREALQGYGSSTAEDKARLKSAEAGSRGEKALRVSFSTSPRWWYNCSGMGWRGEWLADASKLQDLRSFWLPAAVCNMCEGFASLERWPAHRFKVDQRRRCSIVHTTVYSNWSHAHPPNAALIVNLSLYADLYWRERSIGGNPTIFRGQDRKVGPIGVLPGAQIEGLGTPRRWWTVSFPSYTLKPAPSQYAHKMAIQNPACQN